MLKVLIFVLVLATPIFGDDAKVKKAMEPFRNAFQEYAGCGTDANYNKTIDELQKILPGFSLAPNSTFYDAFFTLAANFNLTFSDKEKVERVSVTERFCKKEHDSFNCKVMLLPDYVECFITQKDKGMECLQNSVNLTKSLLSSFCGTMEKFECFKPIFDKCESKVFKANLENEFLCNANRSTTSNSCEIEPSDVLTESSTTEEASNINEDDNTELPIASSTIKAPSNLNNDSNGEIAASTIVQSTTADKNMNDLPAPVPSNVTDGDVTSKSSQKQFKIHLIITLVAMVPMVINFSF